MGDDPAAAVGTREKGADDFGARGDGVIAVVGKFFLREEARALSDDAVALDNLGVSL